VSDAPPAIDPILAPGAELPEGHRVEEVLADGRIGAAYVVRGPHGERRAAHVLHADRVDALREWFIKSAWLREAIDHPHIPRTWAVGTLEDGRPAEITDLLEGETLREALSNRSAPIPLGVVARVVRELAAVLDHLHGRATPVVHRALTPECVLLTAPDGVVKLLGVGDADRPEADPVRPAYLSPEALAEVTSLTARADVFVLASLAYEMLTGKPAFPGTRDEVLGRLREAARPRLADARAELPEAVDETLHACWALAADQRPSCAMEFALAFSTALGVDDTSEHPVTSDTESGGPSLQVMRRRSALLGPTLEVPGPELSSRSFLGPAEQTEVSVSAIPEKPVAPRPTASARAPRSTLRDDAAAREFAPAPPVKPTVDEPLGRTLEGIAPPPAAPAPVAHPSPVPAPFHPPAPSSAVTMDQPSPFTNDLRTTLETQTPALPDESAEPTPRIQAPVQPAPQPVAPPPAAEPPAPVPLVAPTPLAPQPHAQPAPRPRPARSDPPPTDLFAAPPPSPEMPPTMPLPGPTAPAAAPRVQTPAPRVTAPVPAPAPEATEAVTRKAPRAGRSPEAIAFPDEPTGTVPVTPARPRESLWRSPVVVASIFLANAILIVGIAHAIALVANREPAVRLIQGPAPVCAPCAACAACPPPAAPTPAAASPRPAPAPRAAPAPAPRPASVRRPVVRAPF
jgi:serine/threonine protein kinase